MDGGREVNDAVPWRGPWMSCGLALLRMRRRVQGWRVRDVKILGMLGWGIVGVFGGIERVVIVAWLNCGESEVSE